MHARGQTIWMRGVRRRLVDSGRLALGVIENAIGGLETDLVGLSGALERGPEYVEPLLRLGAISTAADVGEHLLAEEAGIAAAALQEVYENSDGRHGLVSVDVDPATANDAEEMSHAARRLLVASGAPNVMAKLPPTRSGFAVFEALVADGLQVHIGPVFSIDSVVRAAAAFERGTAGTAAARVAVLSLGLAPLDNAIDQLLRRRIRAARHDVSGIESLVGGAATAIAKVAWRRLCELALAAASTPDGAVPPRRLHLAWVDLSSSDSRQPRQHYVESLIGADTIAVLDTMLLDAVKRRGRVDATLGQRVDEAEEVLVELAEAGIDVHAVGEALEKEAVRRAQAAYADYQARAAAAADAVAASSGGAADRMASGSPWFAEESEVDDALVDCSELEEGRVVSRMWEKDVSLWSDDDATGELVRTRLGWLDAAASSPPEPEAMRRAAAQLESAGCDSVLLLGMGGSSLAADVCRRAFRSDRLHVLDSTVPAQIKATLSRLDPARTAVLVASKSGTTIEVRALFDWFYALAAPALDAPGKRFAAITDPGTPLEQLAYDRDFGQLWLAPADVGGRFSALTVFGMLPMAVMGIDVAAVHAAARRMAAACAAEVATAANPAARLAAALFGAAEGGRDKITFLPSTSLSAFAPWAEQLIAESTGKAGRGLIPVVDEPAVEAEHYGDDRIFVSLAIRGEDDDDRRQRLDAIEAAGHPLLRLELGERHDLGGEFFRWEAAVAIVGALMGINPFDQPDVQASKDRTAALLSAHCEGMPMSGRPPLAADTEWAVFADIENDEELAARQRGDGLASWLRAHLGRATVPDYVGIQAFLAATPETRRALQGVRRMLVEELGVATTLGWGPAFLHSTGQLHKGGPDSGLFLQVTADDEDDLDIPGAGYSFSELVRAQSMGDLAALQERGRRVLRVHLRDALSGCRLLRAATAEALS